MAGALPAEELNDHRTHDHPAPLQRPAAFRQRRLRLRPPRALPGRACERQASGATAAGPRTEGRGQRDEARLFDGDTLVAQARRTELELTPPAAPSFAEAQAASKSCIGFVRHPLPHCFVCGPKRAEGDGLRIFPGRSADDAVFAAPWVPHASLDDGAGVSHPNSCGPRSTARVPSR